MRPLLVLVALTILATLDIARAAPPAPEAPERDISPLLVATNLWYGDPAPPVWDRTRDAGVRLIRIGGHAYDKKVPTDDTLVAWVKKIRAHGAEPLIQVSQYQPPEKAAALVRLFNLDRAAGDPVRHWSIGNEPWLQNGRGDPAKVASKVVAYFKPVAAAMKAVDPAIKIHGFDEAYFMEPAYEALFGGEHDITGRVPGRSYYYCDGLSWHRYPQTNDEPGLREIADFRKAMEKVRALVDRANAKHGRRGDDALQWGLSEFNAKGGAQVHTFGNGQMFGAVYGYAMRHGAAYAAAWSMFESSGNRGKTDFGAYDGPDYTPRASYWHLRFVGEHFSGRTAAATSGRDDVLVFAAHDAARGRVSVLILNLSDETAPLPYELRFADTPDSAAPASAGLVLTVAFDHAHTHADTLPPRSTQVLAFEKGVLTKTTYTADDFAAARAPHVEQIDLPRRADNFPAKKRHPRQPGAPKLRR